MLLHYKKTMKSYDMIEYLNCEKYTLCGEYKTL